MNTKRETTSSIDPAKATISVEELDRCRAEGIPLRLIDVRTPAEFAEAHIPGAVNIPMDELPSRLADIGSELPAILVCQSGRRAQMCRDTLRHEIPNHSVLAGGTRAWQEAGHAVVGHRPRGLPLMRQVQLVAGLMALSGALLAAFVHPAWIWLSGFVGLGLTVAGTTGFCGLANLLHLLPWNRHSSLSQTSCSPQK